MRIQNSVWIKKTSVGSEVDGVSSFHFVVFIYFEYFVVVDQFSCANLYSCDFRLCDSTWPSYILPPNLCWLSGEITEFTDIWIIRLLSWNINYHHGMRLLISFSCAFLLCCSRHVKHLIMHPIKRICCPFRSSLQCKHYKCIIYYLL